MQIIPAVNCHHKDLECVEDKVRQAEAIGATWIHLDVADGRFTYNKTWNDPAAWALLKTKLQLEVHLMVEDAHEMAHEWLTADAKRLIVHAERLNARSADAILELAKKYGAEVMCATNPETHLKSFPRLLPKFKMYQVLAVHPGLAGQKFLPMTLQKIVALKMMFPRAIIEVDGGVNLETARAARAAGADIAVAATAIFGAEDPRKAYEEFKKI